MTLQNSLLMTTNIIFLAFVGGIPLYAYLAKKINVFDSFVTGAKEGVHVVLKIIPFFIGMLVAIGMFRAAGGIEFLTKILTPLLSWSGLPADVLPLVILRPLSGSASISVMADIIQTHGGNSPISQLAATIMSSTETTFYVVAVYFGAVNIQRTRHAIPAGLIADFAAVVAALWICRLVFG